MNCRIQYLSRLNSLYDSVYEIEIFLSIAGSMIFSSGNQIMFSYPISMYNII